MAADAHLPLPSHRSYLDSEKEGVQSYPELRLHFACLIASIINGVPHGQSRVLLLSAVSRQGLFYLFANWCGLFGQRVDVDTRLRNPQVSFNSLQAMSALLCCGPVFQSNGLEPSSSLYRWLDNMLNCSEARVKPHAVLHCAGVMCVSLSVAAGADPGPQDSPTAAPQQYQLPHSAWLGGGPLL